MDCADAVTFPCDVLPDDPNARRALGAFEQRQEGLIVQRIRGPLGRITAGQWRQVAMVADRYCSGHPIHVTTRHNIELHQLQPGDVPVVQRGLAEAGLTGVGTCGDSIRSMVTCPGNGLVEGTLDVSELMDAIQTSVESLDYIRSLPRKFKVAVCGCGEACVRPWLNDVGLVVNVDGTFRAMVAGSLGVRPNVAIVFLERLDVAQVVPLVVAAVRLFNEEGDRSNRAKARLRHVRERLGDEAFKERLTGLMADEVAGGSWPVPPLPRCPADGVTVQTVLRLAAGNISASDAAAVADVVERADAVMRIGVDHALHLFSGSDLALPASLQGLSEGPRVMACPGTVWCRRAIAHASGLAPVLGEALRGRHDVRVHVSGCPNNCTFPAMADIGLIGRHKTIDGVKQDCYRLVVGGGHGRSSVLGVEIHSAVPTDRVEEAVSWLVGQYDRRDDAGQSFAAFVASEKDRLAEDIRRDVLG